jgi:hypothetical protein
MLTCPLGSLYTVVASPTPIGPSNFVLKLWPHNIITVARDWRPPAGGELLAACSMEAWRDPSTGKIRPRSGSWKNDPDSAAMRAALGDRFERALAEWAAAIAE